MSKIDPNEPAYPVITGDAVYTGMSIRFEAALRLMAGDHEAFSGSYEADAKDALEAADALIKAYNESQQEINAS